MKNLQLLRHPNFSIQPALLLPGVSFALTTEDAIKKFNIDTSMSIYSDTFSVNQLVRDTRS